MLKTKFRVKDWRRKCSYWICRSCSDVNDRIVSHSCRWVEMKSWGPGYTVRNSYRHWYTMVLFFIFHIGNREHLHKLTLGKATECQMIRKLVTRSLPLTRNWIRSESVSSHTNLVITLLCLLDPPVHKWMINPEWLAILLGKPAVWTCTHWSFCHYHIQ